VAAVLFGVAEGALYALEVTDAGAATSTEWQQVDGTHGTKGPPLAAAWQLTPVQGTNWPQRPKDCELVVIDEAGAVWQAVIARADAAARLGARWTRLGAAPPAATDVAPARAGGSRYPAPRVPR
jgi:hypothetical protein